MLFHQVWGANSDMLFLRSTVTDITTCKRTIDVIYVHIQPLSNRHTVSHSKLFIYILKYHKKEPTHNLYCHNVYMQHASHMKLIPDNLAVPISHISWTH